MLAAIATAGLFLTAYLRSRLRRSKLRLSIGYENAYGDENEWEIEIARSYSKNGELYFDATALEINEERTFRADRVTWLNHEQTNTFLEGDAAADWLTRQL